jgi:hypothetical protein
MTSARYLFYILLIFLWFQVASDKTSSCNWFGILFSWWDSKKKSNLILALFEPGNTPVPWVQGLEKHIFGGFSYPLCLSSSLALHFFHILFLSTTLLTGMTGISSHM